VEYNTLAFDEIVIHRVPSRGDAGATGPHLSQAPSPKDAKVFGFFRQRLSGVMARKGLPVEPDNARFTSDAILKTVIDAAGAIISDPTRLDPASQSIAQRLWDTQDARNPAGILVLARGRIDGLPCTGILKLEHERGVQAEEDTDDKGQPVFKVILHDDLLLTDPHGGVHARDPAPDEPVGPNARRRGVRLAERTARRRLLPSQLPRLQASRRPARGHTHVL